MLPKISENEKLMSLWDSENNPDINPETTTCGSALRANWRCPACDYSWETTIAKLNLNGGKCPRCESNYIKTPGKNDVLSLVPRAKDYYNFEKNDNIDISHLGVSSWKEVWWKCPVCGEESYTAIVNKTKKKPDGTYHFKECKHKGTKAPCIKREKKKYKKATSIAETEILFRLWDEKNNQSLNPSRMSCNSREKAMWKCPDCGYSWSCTVQSLYRRNGRCPRCVSNYVKMQGKTDFLTIVPEARRYFDFQKNQGIDISSLGVASSTKVWWKCPVCSEESYTSIVSKIKKLSDGSYRFSGCRNCARKSWLRQKNDSKSPNAVKKANRVSDNEILMSIWDYEKNQNLNPDEFACSSSIRANWKCPKCGYEWCSKITTVNKSKAKCPCCESRSVIVAGINDVFTIVPIAKEYYNREKNTSIDITSLGIASKTRVWWKCPTCGIETYAPIANKIVKRPDGTYYFRTCQNFCNIVNSKSNSSLPGKKPSAKGKTVVDEPKLMKFWDYETNSSLDPNVLTCGSDKEVNWKCSLCGFRWTNSIRQLYLASGECPCCEQKRKAIPGETDVFTIFPEAKKHYNFEKNREMDISSLGIRSREKVWWVCPDCGYESYLSIAKAIQIKNGSYVFAPCRNIDNHPSGKTSFTLSTTEATVASPNDQAYQYPVLSNGLDKSHPAIAKLWSEKNARKPDTLYPNSTTIGIWKCEKCNNEYRERVINMVNQNSVCPFCSNSRVMAGHNSLADKHPDLKCQWSPANSRAMDSVLPDSSYNALWICQKCFGEYDAPVRDKVSGTVECPYCANMRILPGFNSLADTHPNIAAMWSSSNERTAGSVLATSSIPASWICRECGGEYNATVKDVVDGVAECPYCSGIKLLPGLNSLADTHPNIAAMWSPNNERTADSIFATSWFPVSWICPECKGEYNALVKDVVDGVAECPYCSGRKALPGFNSLAVQYPDIALAWDAIKNYAIGMDPDSILPNNATPVWWTCEKGHKYRMSAKNRVLANKRHQVACGCCKGRRRERRHFV